VGNTETNPEVRGAFVQPALRPPKLTIFFIICFHLIVKVDLLSISQGLMELRLVHT